MNTPLAVPLASLIRIMERRANRLRLHVVLLSIPDFLLAAYIIGALGGGWREVALVILWGLFLSWRALSLVDVRQVGRELDAYRHREHVERQQANAREMADKMQPRPPRTRGVSNVH